MFGFLRRLFGSAQDRQVRKYSKIVTQVNEWDEQYKSLTDDQLKAKTQEFRERIAKGESLDSILPEAYGVVKNACRRLCGKEIHVSGYNQKWDMVPYDVQIIGGIALHYGTIAEMQTGEGKTLTATFPLYLNSLTKDPVHLITVNDYLAERDCEWTGNILRYLGITTGVLKNATPQEDRKHIYHSDIVYGTASEFGFDYLRDNSLANSKEEQVQRGFYYAIIDEADSILIDEARTPLIISGPAPVSKQLYDELKEGVSQLVRRQRDYCNKLATEGKKALDQAEQMPEGKERKKIEDEALQKLWLVSKGTPTNKIVKRIKEDPDLRAALDNWDLYYYSDQNKDAKNEALANLYMIIDERANEYELTDKGIQGWLECTNGIGHIDDFLMMDISHEFNLIDEDDSLSEQDKVARKLAVQEEDSKRKERSHNLRQMLRAHLLMEKDVDYIIQDNKIVIIDENTGRAQPGRRFSDGLHQAIEAKEGLEIQKETQTYATITLQNYFRMYKKLAGMTGTASTDALELKQIYKLEVLAIPTHKQCKRTDFNDEIYMTEREKYNAILTEIRTVNEADRPILIGTESVEVSEKLSRILRQNQLPHTVLNAKQHEKEAEIIANAGQKKAITIATNMAGRGTDIKLGEGVADCGGLYVIGTTRHQSRRTDRQLRGRCARQGDPGTSKFYISFEDQLLRLFTTPKMTAFLQRFRPPEGEPISAGILNKSVETAQKRIEQRNFTIRKHTIEYDDVMNKQRQAIYGFRNEVLHSDDIENVAIELLEEVCVQGADKFLISRSQEDGWNPEGYREWLMKHFPITFEVDEFNSDYAETDEIAAIAAKKVVAAFKEKLNRENSKFAPREDGRKPTDNALRNMMIRKNDQLWQEHLHSMDHLRSDVNLRAVGQRDPLTEFKHEAFNLFEEFSMRLREEIGHDLFRFEIVPASQFSLPQLLKGLKMETARSFLTDLQPPSQEIANGEPVK